MKKLELRLSILNKPVDENSFALLRFLVELMGKKNAREIVNLLANNQSDNVNLEKAQTIIHSCLKERYPSFKAKSDEEIEKEIINLYDKANEIIKKLIKISFPNMEFKIGLLDSTIVSKTNIAEIVSLLMENKESTQIYKYELLRQIVVALIILKFETQSFILQSRKNLDFLQSAFEEELLEGKMGEFEPHNLFSVHDNTTNTCLAVFPSHQAAKDYLKSDGNSNCHIKKHLWSMRTVDGIGPILMNMRIKNIFSILIKIIYKANKKQRKEKKIDPRKKENVVDLAGFMFVAPVGKKEELMEKIIKIIKDESENVTIIRKNKVNNDRGQSSKVNFLRVLVRLKGTLKPIEIIVFDQNEYINYRFEFEQAHKLFVLRKSTQATNLLFPKAVYHLDEEEMEMLRKQVVKKIEQELLQQNRE